jgi:hypothetical protein
MELRNEGKCLLGVTVLAALSPIPQVSLSNGHLPEIQGNAPKKVNGRSHAPKLKANLNNEANEVLPSSENPDGRSSPAPSPLKVLTSSPAVAGKKRKKTTVS